MTATGGVQTANEEWSRVDPHVKVLDQRVVERAKAAGLDAIVYAPHFTRLPEIAERAAAFSDETLTVVPGREVFAGSWRHRKHVLALGLSDPVADFITLDGAMAEFDRQDATVLIPHPDFLTVSLDAEEIARYRDLIQGLEIYNPKHSRWHNSRAREIAADFGLPTFASSYAHLGGSVGEVWTRLPVSIDEPADLIGALVTGSRRQTGHRVGVTHRLRCVAEAAHLAWENSYQKIDRVLLSGREATHPGHPAYEGRFDDVAVY